MKAVAAIVVLAGLGLATTLGNDSEQTHALTDFNRIYFNGAGSINVS